MGKNAKGSPGQSTKDGSPCSCRIESMVSVDERGQMVLPKDLREKAGIRPGDRLALISWEKDGNICCITLVKSDEFSGMIKDTLGPIMKDVLS